MWPIHRDQVFSIFHDSAAGDKNWSTKYILLRYKDYIQENTIQGMNGQCNTENS